MISPTKEQRLHRNILVEGAQLLKVLKKGSISFDDARDALGKYKHFETPSSEKMMDIITMLYMLDMVEVVGVYLSIKDGGLKNVT